MVKNLSADAWNTGLILGLGTKIPHAAVQLGLCATTTESAGPRAGAPQQEKPLQEEACAP